MKPLQQLIADEARQLSSAQQNAAKRAAAQAAVSLVQDGMTLGLGTGSTVAFFLEGLARRIAEEGLRVTGVPTSRGTEALAERHGIPLLGSPGFARLSNDLCVDGADRVDAQGTLIKGGGGALLREKMVASHSQRVCILVDATKLEQVLSNSFPLPVECLPFGIESTLASLKAQGCTAHLRERDGAPWVTDNGNLVVDCGFDSIADPGSLERGLLTIPGVVEVGLFLETMTTLILGRPDGTVRFAEFNP